MKINEILKESEEPSDEEVRSKIDAALQDCHNKLTSYLHIIGKAGTKDKIVPPVYNTNPTDKFDNRIFSNKPGYVVYDSEGRTIGHFVVTDTSWRDQSLNSNGRTIKPALDIVYSISARVGENISEMSQALRKNSDEGDYFWQKRNNYELIALKTIVVPVTKPNPGYRDGWSISSNSTPANPTPEHLRGGLERDSYGKRHGL
jgi:hypothetical protein